MMITTPRHDGAKLLAAFHVPAGNSEGFVCQVCKDHIGPDQYHECWSAPMTQPVSPPSVLDDEAGKGPVSATPQTAIGAVLVWHSAEQLQRIEDKLDRLLAHLKESSK